MVKLITSLIVLSIFLLSELTQATSPLDVDIGLYHASIKQVGSNCTTVRIPWGMCPKCKLLNFTGTGPNLNFNGVNRFDIYDLNDTSCKNMIKRYIDNNQCDTTRARAYDNFYNKQKAFAYKTLIYFMYSACETCCDCIPIGSRIEDYEQRKKNGTLIHIERGNCAAHMHYDTCKIWPEMEQITGLNGAVRSGAKWCPDFKTWQFSPNAKGWLKNNDVDGLTWKMKKGMRQMTSKGRCTEETQWKNCVRMEQAQFRV